MFWFWPFSRGWPAALFLGRYFGRGLFGGYQGKSVLRTWVVLNRTEEQRTEIVAHVIAAAELVSYFVFAARDVLDALHPGCASQALIAVILGYIQYFAAVVGDELLQAAGVIRDVQGAFVIELDACVFHGAYCFVRY
jgi:hypothetical protein